MTDPKSTTEARSWQRREERRFSLIFLGCLIGLWLIWHFTSGHPTSARVAALGGAIATFGGLLMVMPVLRVGPFQYIVNVTWGEEMEELTGQKTPEPSRDTRASDLINQNVMGPYLVAVGTIVNGFSGLIS